MVRTGIVLLCAALLAACSSAPDRRADRSGTASSPRAGPLPAPRSAEVGQCLTRLVQMGAQYREVEDRYVGQGCHLLGSVQLASLASDSSNLSISNIGPVTCEVSQVFSGWARYGVDRAARQLLGSPVRTIETMGSYSCRNVAGTSRRSAHSTGAAIDVSGFVLEDGRRISVKNGWHGGTAMEQQFLRTIQQSACKRFDTVLGPDYNAAHHDHLHLEGVIGSSSYCR